MNVSRDIATCESCGAVFAASDAIRQAAPAGDISMTTADVPAGVEFEADDRGFKIKVRYVSIRSAVIFAVAAFIVLVVINQLILEPVLQDRSLWQLFPGGLALSIFAFFMTGLSRDTYGTITIVADGDNGRIDEGWGPMARRFRFDWRDIEDIWEGRRPSGVYVSLGEYVSTFWMLHLEGVNRIAFGGMMNHRQRRFVLQIIRTQIESLRASGRARGRTVSLISL